MNQSIVANTIKTRYEHLKSEQQEVFDQVEKFRQMYRCAMTEDESYPWDYQLVDPQIFPIVRAHLARLNPAEARVLLEGPDEERRVLNQNVVNWELNELLITQVLYRNMFTGFIAGRGYLKTGWLHKNAVVIESDRGPITMSEMVNRMDVRNVRFNDMFIPNRNIPELTEQPYLVERVSMRFGDMLEDVENGITWKPDMVKYIKEKKIFSNHIDYGVDTPQDANLTENTILKSQNVALLLMTTIDGEQFYVLENGPTDKLLNKSTESPHWHGHYDYIDFSVFPEDDEFFNLGIVQPNADLQIALTSTLNQLLTNARKAGNPMWITGQNAAQTPDWMFVNRPDGIIRVVGDVNSVQQVKQNDTSGSLVGLRGVLQTSFERTSGMSSLYSSGVADSGQVNKTATGAKIISNNIDQNIELLVSLYGAQILKRLGEHALELNAQYMTDEQIINITGKKGKTEYVKVSPEQISANYKVKSTPERMLRQNPVIRQSQLMNLFSTLKGSKYLNELEMDRLIINAFPETEDSENLLIDPEDVAEEAIELMEKGIEPNEPKINQDLEMIMNLVQKHLLEAEQIEDETLVLFEAYISKLKLMLEARNKNLVVSPPPQPQIQPTDEASLMQSMNQQLAPQGVGESLPIPLTQNQTGQMPSL